MCWFTALALGRSVAAALGRNLEKVAANGRKGIVGEHTVTFGGIGERLEFIHRTHSRDAFARCAPLSSWQRKSQGLLDGGGAGAPMCLVTRRPYLEHVTDYKV
jgi:4-hydroxy-tetrahydrodipicolinate reductase